MKPVTQRKQQEGLWRPIVSMTVESAYLPFCALRASLALDANRHGGLPG